MLFVFFCGLTLLTGFIKPVSLIRSGSLLEQAEKENKPGELAKPRSHGEMVIKTDVLVDICNVSFVENVELLCAADNNGRCHLGHGGHKASDRLRVNITLLHHHCRRRLSGLLCNGRFGL